MKPLQRLILVLALLWITVKLMLFYTGNSVEGIQIVVSLNIGFTVFIIYKALQQHYSELEGTSDFLKDITASLKACAQYSLIIFGFLAIYYIYIDSLYIEHMVDNRMVELKMKMAEEGGFDAVMEKYKDEIIAFEDAQDLTEEEYYDEVRVNYLKMMNIKMVLAVIFMGLFFINLACSAVFSGVYKRFFLKQA